MYKFFLWFVVTIAWSQGHDPFVVPVKKNHGALKQQRIQYLGFIKVDVTTYGFVRRVGGDIERIQKGKVGGIGKVVTISAHLVCMVKNHQRYCLDRTLQMNHWKRVERK